MFLFCSKTGGEKKAGKMTEYLVNSGIQTVHAARGQIVKHKNKGNLLAIRVYYYSIIFVAEIGQNHQAVGIGMYKKRQIRVIRPQVCPKGIMSYSGTLWVSLK